MAQSEKVNVAKTQRVERKRIRVDKRGVKKQMKKVGEEESREQVRRRERGRVGGETICVLARVSIGRCNLCLG